MIVSMLNGANSRNAKKSHCSLSIHVQATPINGPVTATGI